MIALASGLNGSCAIKHTSFTLPWAQLEATCFCALFTNKIDAQHINLYFFPHHLLFDTMFLPLLIGLFSLFPLEIDGSGEDLRMWS